MQLAALLSIILLLSGVFLPVFHALGKSEFVRRHRRREDRPYRIDPAVYRKSSMINSAVSGGILFGGTLLLRKYLISGESVSLLRTLYQAAAILALYDLSYYLLHRFVFHEWSIGRRIHSVHHSIRTPYAKDSLYIHPIETASGVGLLLVCTAIIGPVGLASFGLALSIYSLLNVFIHSSVDLRFFPFRSITALVRNHDIHHDSMKSGYYASITPLWDVVFRTAGTPHKRA
jgi:sterol desaturase/sphingolipid hydroxylase (fatty acid hydroxylase superfamily)